MQSNKDRRNKSFHLALFVIGGKMRSAGLNLGQSVPPLQRAFIDARVVEAAENFSRACVPQVSHPSAPRLGPLTYVDDELFWREVLAEPGKAWNKRVVLADLVAFSEWVARVPGLYWRPESERLRYYSSDVIEGFDLGGVTLRPHGKSQIVIGGVGTLKLPPSAEGYRLCTVTMSANVSCGIPALVSPETWSRHSLCEGSLLRVQESSWVQMPHEWSARFPSTRGLALGCLLLTDPGTLKVEGQDEAVQIHPCTIMSYTNGAAELFDFVFATGYTGDRAYRNKLEEFFDSYKQREGRQGRYLIAGDIDEPLWTADYTRPEDLNRAEPAASSHLKLLERRVRARLDGDDTETRVLQALCTAPDLDYLRRISAHVGIDPATWVTGGTIASAAAQFFAKIDHEQNLPGLLEALAIVLPQTLQAS
jgi:hypothetical protein